MTQRALPLICLVSSLAWTNPAAAQAHLRVILFGSEPAPTWVTSLGVELRAEGGELIRGSVPTVGDAQVARAEAREAGADAALWLDSDAGVTRVHLLAVDGPGELAAALDEGRDSRTVALVVVSLLDEAISNVRRGRVPAPLPAPGSEPSSRLDRPLPVAPSPSIDSQYESWVVEDGIGGAAPRQLRSNVYGGIGAGLYGLVSDRGFDLGGHLRAMVGALVRDLVRVQVTGEGGLYNDRLVNGGKAQPFGRLCPEVALVPRIGDGLRLSVGARGCGGLGIAYYIELVEDAFGTLVYPGEGLFATLAAGGSIGLEVSTGDGMSVWIQASLEGAAWVDASREPDVLTSLSTTLEFF